MQLFYTVTPCAAYPGADTSTIGLHFWYVKSLNLMLADNEPAGTLRLARLAW